MFTISPLEVLAAFALAFLGGLLSGLGLNRYTDWVRKQTLCAAKAAADAELQAA